MGKGQRKEQRKAVEILAETRPNFSLLLVPAKNVAQDFSESLDGREGESREARAKEPAKPISEEAGSRVPRVAFSFSSLFGEEERGDKHEANEIGKRAIVADLCRR